MDKLDIVIATGNKNKVIEFKELFEKYPFNVTSMKDEGIVLDIEETGTTFKENAILKAKAVAKLTNKIVISDDSGISVHALDGFPGIHSARWMEGHSYDEKNQVLLDMIKDKEDKTAHYTCAIAVMNFPGQEDQVFEGICEGTLIPSQKGTTGFGYDPIFMPKGKNCSFSMMSEDEKNTISHRANASKLLIEFIEKSLKTIK